MANENVKIIIQESNETTPKGSGVSSDIAYVPGLAVDAATSKNVPVLCSTVSEFEANFGSEPYVMTDADVSYLQYANGMTAGSYDRSYIYAKELINAGMTVLYENIAPVASAPKVISDVGFVPAEGSKVTGTKNSFAYASTAKSETDELYNFTFKVTGNPLSGSATLVANFPAFSGVIELSKVECTNAGKFTIETTAKTSVIKWSNIDQTTLDHTVFTAEVKVKPSKAVTDYKFELTVLKGTQTSATNAVADSRIKYFYDELNARLNNIEDKTEYSVKYITSGGYPTFIKLTQDDGSEGYPLADALIDCAAQRGDAVALIDPVDDPEDPLRPTDPESVYARANSYFNGGNCEYGAMFIPWGTYSCVTITDPNKMMQLMPPSFGYLMCMATAIKTSPNWLAMAGVTRGIVPNLKSLHVDTRLSNVIAEDYQPKYGTANGRISINAITNIQPYGLAIWGNRTLEPVAEKGTTALNFLNTRNMISDIKKLAYSTAKELMFEQDSDTLWLNFKSRISPLLDQLKSGNGISNYKIIRGTTKYNGKALTRGEMAAVIKIYPLYAIEYFEITVAIADEDVSVQ